MRKWLQLRKLRPQMRSMIHLNRLELQRLCKDLNLNKDHQRTSFSGKILLSVQMNRHM
jgi:hypothetical protein